MAPPMSIFCRSWAGQQRNKKMTDEEKKSALAELAGSVQSMEGTGMILTATACDEDEDNVNTQCKVVFVGQINKTNLVAAITSPIVDAINIYSKTYKQALSLASLKVLAENLGCKAEIKKEDQ
jgi:hypothetical protein